MILRLPIFVLLILLINIKPASAHHQLGLPHYSYRDDYPQIPKMEIEAWGEGYHILFTTFPGNPNPGQYVKLKFYIKHLTTGEPFIKPVTYTISKETFFGGKETLSDQMTLSPSGNEYAFHTEFPEAEKYIINLSFNPRPDHTEMIPFPLVVGKTESNILSFFAIILFIMVSFTVIRLVIGKRNKKSAERLNQ